ncbi:C-type lectin protein [Ranid herpesvirus 3]|uniref:C-type lectin protein n=1 Tax=Ranid herpesvirus 3 TaxID=1987509 RepID=A0A1X9T5G1_9VIRU|nr:C-type lectin protein [Ranid herpesvirus 3]ARR28933.1 C-type lectin protein [Ranid herpesvirus 3]
MTKLEVSSALIKTDERPTEEYRLDVSRETKIKRFAFCVKPIIFTIIDSLFTISASVYFGYALYVLLTARGANIVCPKPTCPLPVCPQPFCPQPICSASPAPPKNLQGNTCFCPDGWFTSENQCLRLIDEKLTYAEAKNKCDALNMQMITRNAHLGGNQLATTQFTVPIIIWTETEDKVCQTINTVHKTQQDTHCDEKHPYVCKTNIRFCV